MEDKKRNLVWDNYKGILIFLVVFSHFLYAYSLHYPGTYINKIVTFIYLFHMPAFVFCSGYFSTSDNSKSKKSILKLLLYYIIFNTLMMIFLYFYSGKRFIFMTPYNSYWYLLSLIFWRLSIKYFDKIKGIIPLSFIIALAIGYHSDFSNVLSIKRTIAFFPFFIAGYKLAKGELLSKLNTIINNKNTKTIVVSLVFLIVFSVLIYLIIRNYQISNAMLLMGAYHGSKYLLFRVFMFGVASIMMLLLLLTCTNKYVPILTKAGKNSLGIYVLHRFFTLIFILLFPVSTYSNTLILYSFICAFILIILLGSDYINNFINNTVTSISNSIIDQTKKGKRIEVIIIILFIIALLLKPITSFFNIKITPINSHKTSSLNVKKTNYLSDDTKSKINSSIKISYVGDLILLKDQVKSAYNEQTKEYEFDDMFKYTKKYFDDSDLSIGVFEGPTAGSSVPYSTSNYGDGIKLYLNFPDSFAKSVKDSGIDLVTTANNHLLDRGYKGAIRTIDILDKYDIKHVGSYKNQKEKDNLFIIDVKGVKIAVLSYISAMNYYKLDDVYEKYPTLTSVIPRDNSRNYNKMYKDIKNDFKKAKESEADLIMVMPHMGTQFTHSTNAFQKKWNKIFASLGADIILGDHAHAVQPIEYIGNTAIVNCPGNFANSYVKHDGDATAIVDLYIDKETKKVIATDVIPMYTQEFKNGYFRALPIYDIMNDRELSSSMSTYELHRVEEVSKLITKVMIKREVSLKNVKQSYYFINNNHYTETDFLDIIEKYKDKELYKLINKSNKIVFIGDSITEGTMNNYHPYYEPLMDTFQDKKVVNISKGSYTTKKIIRDYQNDIIDSKGDLYIIAIGTNDVRYRNKKTCAYTSDEYVKQIDKIVELIKKSNSDAKIVFIAPWFSLSDDTVSRLNEKDKNEMMDKYSSSIEKYSKENNYMYINPNNYLKEEVNKDRKKYMVDFIHPNDSNGIKLYSEAILHESK